MSRVRKVVSVTLAALGLLTINGVQAARALTTSDKPAAIIIWPKIVVDTANGIDTLIQLSNTSNVQKQAHCFLVNANGHCADNSSRSCQSSADCITGTGEGTFVAECIPGWNEIDFDVNVTQEQPLAWYASSGLSRGQFPIEGPFKCNAPLNFIECFNDAQCGGFGCNVGSNNFGSAVPPTPEDPFIGTLKCIQYTGGNGSIPDQAVDAPGARNGTNKLIATATIINRRTAPLAVDVEKYNAVGIRATNFDDVGTDPNHSVLQIGLTAGGGPGEYQACPATLILNHLFDGATDPISTFANETVRTDLTLVPCGDDFLTQTPGRATAQFLVFNEFEQRFSTSRTIDCFYESFISNIDTRNSARSIFSAGVAGTIAGQTRIRGVGSASTGRGLVGVARVFSRGADGTESGAAYNLHQQANPAVGVQPDLITIP